MKKGIIIFIIVLVVAAVIFFYVRYKKKKEAEASGETKEDKTTLRTAVVAGEDGGEPIETITDEKVGSKMIVRKGNGEAPTEVAERGADGEIKFRAITEEELAVVDSKEPKLAQMKEEDTTLVLRKKEVKHPFMKKIMGTPSTKHKKTGGGFFHKKKAVTTAAPTKKTGLHLGILKKKTQPTAAANASAAVKKGMFKKRK